MYWVRLNRIVRKISLKKVIFQQRHKDIKEMREGVMQIYQHAVISAS